MKRSILFVLALCLFGCGGEVNPASDRTVHLAGYVGVPDLGSAAAYWKDGVHTALPDDSTASNISSLYVDGSSVFIGGRRLSVGSILPAVFWQDGSLIDIAGSHPGTTLIASRNNDFFGVWYDNISRTVYSKKGHIRQVTNAELNFEVTGLALLGDDMYMSGKTLKETGQATYQHARTWKDGQPIFTEDEVSDARSIFIHRDDIYMAGYLYGPLHPRLVASYWKNGTRVDLTNETVNAIATSVFVTDEHVYASGFIDNQAVYWKDGEAIYLTNEGTGSMANSIFVKGEDVHVAGNEHGHPAYWKNNVKQEIAHQDKRGDIKFVVVGSN